MKKNLNEFSLLMAKLSQHSINGENADIINYGATIEELADLLGFSGKFQRELLLKKLFAFQDYIQPLGLILRVNPFNNKWFLTSTDEIANFLKTNPFENRPRLAAALFTIITLLLIKEKDVNVEDIRKFRKKQSIEQDLLTLEKLKYIQIIDDKITLDANIGYFINFKEFMNSMQNFTYKNQ